MLENKELGASVWSLVLYKKIRIGRKGGFLICFEEIEPKMNKENSFRAA